MKPSLEKILPSLEASANIHRSTSVRGYRFDWHQHPEVELTLIRKGSGLRYVGETVRSFTAPDIVLLGGMVPHTWDVSGPSEAVILQFQPFRLLGDVPPPEYLFIPPLLRQAERGLEFTGPLKEHLAAEINEIPERSAFERRERLLHLLYEISEEQQDARSLSDVTWEPGQHHAELQRIDSACGFMHSHYLEPLRLEDIAHAAGMSEAALCRAFKRATRKTVLFHLTSLRIHHAMRMLRDRDSSISEVAFSSGFQNLSTFNRNFKEHAGMTPGAYRMTWRTGGTFLAWS